MKGKKNRSERLRKTHSVDQVVFHSVKHVVLHVIHALAREDLFLFFYFTFHKITKIIAIANVETA